MRSLTSSGSRGRAACAFAFGIAMLLASRHEARAAIVDVTDANAPKPVVVSAGGSSDGGALTVVDSAINRMSAAKGLQPLGDNAFGESHDLFTGNLSFQVTDVRLQGTGPDIEITRSLNVRTSASAWWVRERAFGDWDLELPRLTTKTPHPALQAPWQVAGANPSARCSNFGNARNVTINNFVHQASEWWEGVQLVVPGQDNQEVLLRAAQNTASPTMQFNGAPLTFPLVTARHWMISCLPQTSNGTPGDAFLAVSPQGDKYWFDHLVTGGRDWYVLPFASGYALYRYDAQMLPSRIEDRHGNWLDFDYDGARLTGITASDGRAVSVTWQSVNNLSFITAVTEQPGDAKQRSWAYGYLTPNSGRTLNKVTLPDQSAWTYNFEKMTRYCLWWQADAQSPWCDDNSGNWGQNIGTVTAPSGLVGSFEIQGGFGGRILLPEFTTPDCYHEPQGPADGFFTVLLFSKTYSGPGLTPAKWTVVNTCPYPGCVNTVPNTYLKGILDPQGRRTLHYFDAVWCSADFGDVKRTDIGAVIDAQNNIVSTARTITVTNSPTDAGPYPTRIGLVPQTYANRRQLEHLRPLKQRTITQDGATFTWTAASFDTFGRPVQVQRSSSLGHSRTETTSYKDHLPRWLLGQVATLTEQSTGAVMFGQSFDAVTGNASSQSQFGKLAQTLTYHTDGTVATISDAKSQTLEYQNYKRGIPQTVMQPDGVSTHAAVDNLGQIGSTTDGTGFTTTYGYDPAGRLNSTTYPAGDAIAWAPETMVFERVPVSEYGIAAGHWRATASHGNHRKTIYFDGRWQPILTREYDVADAAGTDRFVARQFDFAGHETFVSYPVDNVATWSAITQGRRTEYDILGRVTRREQDSELGELATATAYLSPFKVQVTSPKNLSTTTTFFALDEPTYEAPLVTVAPEGITSTVVRDVFGKPTSITRSGSWNNAPISATRSFVYDANQKLCKAIEPDAGTTVIDYDLAGDVLWRATGLNLPAPNTCDRNNVSGSQRSIFGYDALHRVTSIDHPSGTNDVSFTYYDDGSLHKANAGAAAWTYSYNRRRLLESETLSIDGKSFALDWGYNAQGQLASLVYPSGLNIGFDPNVFGAPRQAGTFASGVIHLPNGLIDGFNYGNGATRDVTPNMRGLPDRIRDTGAAGVLLDQTLDYDAHGNLVGILDGVPGGLESRTLWYDGRDRLTAVTNAPTGDEAYSYDPLDNVRSALTNGFDRRFHYDALTGRLQRTANGNGVTEVSYAWNTRGEMTGRSSPLLTVPLPAGVVFRSGFESPGIEFDAARHLVNYMGLETHTYDAHDHRVKTSTGANATRYQIYSRGGQLLYIEDSGRNERVDYVYLDRTLVAKRSRPFASGIPITSTYLHSDQRGTPTVESDSTGGMTLRSRLKPYGEPYDGIYRQGPGFTGHAVDEMTELVYMQKRYYDTLSQRFVSPDPIGSSQDSFNRYWYANNNPYTFIDPDGRWACEGTGAECDQIRAAANLIEGALENDNLTRSERAQLGNARNYIGDHNDPSNNVIIKFGNDVPKGASGYVDKHGNIILSKSKVARSAAQGNGGSAQANTENALARNISHEADHAYRFSTREAWEMTRHQIEFEGYRAAAIYQKATGWLDIGSNAWLERTGISEDVLDDQARGSIAVSCPTSSSCR